MNLDHRDARPPIPRLLLTEAPPELDAPAGTQSDAASRFGITPAWSFAQHSGTTFLEGVLFPGRRFHPEPPHDTVVPLEARQSGRPSKQPRGLSRGARTRALEFMERHIGDDVCLDDIARAACVSRSHFARLFRVSMGDSPMGHLLHMRIERAKTLLAQNDQSICSIALSLGFFDQSHFSRTFRRLAGVSPSEFARTY